MQVSGQPCAICSKRVSIQYEATWCARCQSVLHHSCLEAASGHCPKCEASYDEPSSHFQYSTLCPRCLHPNEPPKADCTKCNARTCWDTRQEYESFVSQVRSHGSRCYFLGLFLVIMPLWMLLVVPSIWMAGLAALGIYKGVVKLSEANKARKFH